MSAFPAVDFERALNIKIGTISTKWKFPVGLAEVELDRDIKDFIRTKPGDDSFDAHYLLAMWHATVKLNSDLYAVQFSESTNSDRVLNRVNALHGVASKFNLYDLIFYFENKRNRSDPTMMARRREIKRVCRKSIDWVPSPETLSMIENHLGIT